MLNINSNLMISPRNKIGEVDFGLVHLYAHVLLEWMLFELSKTRRNAIGTSRFANSTLFSRSSGNGIGGLYVHT